MVKRRFLCSLLCCSPCCAVLALVGANTRFVGANAMFATFAPRILWFAQRNLWLAPPNTSFAPRNLRFAPPNTSFALGIFSKITPSLFTIKEGSTSFPKPLSPQGTGDVPTALLGAQTATLYGWRTIRGLRQQRSCGFLCGMGPPC